MPRENDDEFPGMIKELCAKVGVVLSTVGRWASARGRSSPLAMRGVGAVRRVPEVGTDREQTP